MGILYDVNKNILDMVSRAVEINAGDDENPKIELVDFETGELLTEQMKSLETSKKNILLSLAKEIKNLKAEETALKNEIENFDKRIESIQAKKERFAYVIKKYGYGEQFKDTEAAIRWRKSPIKVEIEDVAKIPAEYGKEQKFVPDITRIKAALKAGETVPGTYLTRNDDSLVIQ